MFPFKEGLTYARNQWYVAGWSDEFAMNQIRERWILGEPVAMYRTASGVPVAVDGRCPHRNYPMAKGLLRGDNIQCGYHGIEFDPRGVCVRIPSQSMIPAVCHLRSYPLIEQWQLVWIWPGDPALADPALIPSHEELRLQKQGWLATRGFTFELKTRYQLLNENLMDISHLSFLHAGTIGTEAVAATEVILIEGERFLRGTRKMKNDQVTGFFAQVLNYEGKIDRETLIDYYAPGMHVAWEFFMKPGTLDTLVTDDAEANENVLGMYRVHHMVTPATLDTTNYFIGYSRTFARDQDSVTKTMTTVFESVIQQDIAAAEAIENLLNKRGSAPNELLIKADAHSIRGRRRLESLMERERSMTSTAPN